MKASNYAKRSIQSIMEGPGPVPEVFPKPEPGLPSTSPQYALPPFPLMSMSTASLTLPPAQQSAPTDSSLLSAAAPTCAHAPPHSDDSAVTVEVKLEPHDVALPLPPPLH